jgi:hypothetical protein
VQCKWAPKRGNVIVVNLQTHRCTPHGHVRSTYTPEEVDGIAVYCQALKRCFYLPIEKVQRRRVLHLRLAPAANNQAAAINWAADFELGAIAQLGERRAGSAKVVGSSPTSSIGRKPCGCGASGVLGVLAGLLGAGGSTSGEYQTDLRTAA